MYSRYSLLFSYLCRKVCHVWGFQVVLAVKKKKKSVYNAGDIRDVDLVPGLGRSPGGVYGNPLQYSDWRIPLDRRAWQATVHRVTNNRT